jgi:poly-gamma-glutamate synthesis protein (capsule biosynthesis protein)
LRPILANASASVAGAEAVNGSLTVALAPNLPANYASPVRDILGKTTSVSTGSWLKRPLHVLDTVDAARAQVKMEPLSNTQLNGAYPLMERYYAVVAPFDTVADEIELNELRLRWQGLKSAPLYITEAAARDLPPVLGTRRVSVLSESSWNTLFASTPDAIGILPFEELDPSYKVLTVDGMNPLDNRLDPKKYPLAVAITVRGQGASIIASLLRASILPQTNRDPAQLTTLVMTGVTAMTRGTAARMERFGYTYPAEVISGTLRAADITHISNEVPFLNDCVVNATPNNLIMCSHTNYWATLEAIGTDIVGLSGNHVNDFGRAGARESITWYRENGIAIYGSGMNADEACQPLLWYHNGNTFAFLAALAYGPSGAWATDEQPGACYYYDHKERVLNAVAELAQEVDIVAVELQYEETYNPFPTANQVEEFRELRAAGADIVTGVQSHVPQSMEPYGANELNGPGIIVYGLGNLFFDQMWSWETRTGLIARHTIYQGRLLNTEILTTVLEDYAQPRWTTPGERAELLRRIFNAAPAKPPVTATLP